MTEQERPLIDRVWDFTKDLSIKVSRQAEKHWKINTLRVEIASIKHRVSVKYKDLGRFVYESLKSGSAEDRDYKDGLRDFFEDISRLDDEIEERENRIAILEREAREAAESQRAAAQQRTAGDAPPPPPPSGEEDDDSEGSDASRADAEDESGPSIDDGEPAGEENAADSEDAEDVAASAKSAKSAKSAGSSKRTSTAKKSGVDADDADEQ